MNRLRVGTTNLGKLREFRQVLEPLGFSVIGIEELQDLDIVEDAATFEENAIIKAQAVMEATGEPTVADDSGIEVDALDKRPGVHSARYAAAEGPNRDAANRQKLLEKLGETNNSNRTARFVCALAYCVPNREPKLFRATCEGTIAREERGDNGFGYDSIFLVEGDRRTAAELSANEKNEISHRGKALRMLAEHLATHKD